MVTLPRNQPGALWRPRGVEWEQGERLKREGIYAYICVYVSVSQFSQSVQSLSRVRLFATPWNAARQASLSITNSRSLLNLMSIKSVMPSNHLILCCPFSSCLQSFPASGSLPVSCLFSSGGQSIGVSASASVLPMNIQDWFPLGLISLIFLESKGAWRVFSNTTVGLAKSRTWLSDFYFTLINDLTLNWISKMSRATSGTEQLYILSFLSS